MRGKLVVFRANRHTSTVFAIMTSAGISERKSPEPPKCFANRPHRCIFASSSASLLLCFQCHYFTFHHCLGRPSCSTEFKRQISNQTVSCPKRLSSARLHTKPGARHAEHGWRRANCCRSPRNPPYATRPKVFESTATVSTVSGFSQLRCCQSLGTKPYPTSRLLDELRCRVSQF